MNKRGFTLIELLAVIVILALLALLLVSTFLRIINDSRDSLTETQEKMVLNAVKKWEVANFDKITSDPFCLKTEELITGGYLIRGDLELANKQELPPYIKFEQIGSTSQYKYDIVDDCPY